MLLPSISQIAAWPLVLCHRMSEWPSPLKSPVPIAFQLGPGLATSCRLADYGVPVHFPDRGLAAGVLPQDIQVRSGGARIAELTDTWLVTGADALTPSLTDQRIVRLEVVALAEAYVMELSSAS